VTDWESGFSLRIKRSDPLPTSAIGRAEASDLRKQLTIVPVSKPESLPSSGIPSSVA
jgi:hypothetical protein